MVPSPDDEPLGGEHDDPAELQGADLRGEELGFAVQQPVGEAAAHGAGCFDSGQSERAPLAGGGPAGGHDGAGAQSPGEPGASVVFADGDVSHSGGQVDAEEERAGLDVSVVGREV